MTGSVLLHLSPYGLEEPMFGRYAFVQDQVALMHEAIIKVKTILESLGRPPERIFFTPGRESQALALATARILQVDAQPWPAGGTNLAGLIVADDLAAVPVEVLKTLRDHRAGQVLWSHATSWIDEGPFAADLVTFLYQTRIGPWTEGRLHSDPATRETTRLPAAPGTPHELADQILAAPPESAPDEPLLTLAQKAARITNPTAGGTWRTTGTRRRQRTDSPVQSARFN